MLRIAYCGHIPLVDGDVREVVESCAQKAGAGDVILKEYENPLDVIDEVLPAKAQLGMDAIICGPGMPGMEPIQLARELRHEGYDGHIIMGADDPDDAAEAFSMHVCGYFVGDTTVESFSEPLMRVLYDAVSTHGNCLDLRTRDGFRRVRLSQLVYSETDDHDQKIHLMDGTTFNIRMSSAAFFEVLSGSGQFFKAGSSFIVNMARVRYINAAQSMAVMADGTKIPIPGRVRKSLEKAILGGE